MLIDSAVVIESCTFLNVFLLIMHDGPDVNLVTLDLYDSTVLLVDYLNDRQDARWSYLIDNAPDYQVEYLA